VLPDGYQQSISAPSSDLQTPFNPLDFTFDGNTLFGSSSISAPEADQPASDIVAWWSDIFSIPFDTSEINFDTSILPSSSSVPRDTHKQALRQ
jgi:hypothetical protein